MCRGAIFTDILCSEVWLTCTVECSPLCSVSWYRNNSLLSNSTQYQVLQLQLTTSHYCDVQIREAVKLKDYRTNTLSHVESHLTFNIPSWAGGSLVPGRDTNLYTCSSSGNREGPGVNTTTTFR